MKKIMYLLLPLLLVNSLYALPKKIQADRYLLQAKKSIENKDHKKAIEYFEKILALNIEVPNSFHYHYAKSLEIERNYEACVKHLDIFLTNGGDITKFYTKALDIYTKCEVVYKEKQRIEKQKIAKLKKEQEIKKQNYIKEHGTNIDILTYKGLEYGIIKSPHTNRIWLDRNLGAKEICKSKKNKQCYGDYFQWGRNFDGHEKDSSEITNLIEKQFTLKNNKFITSNWENRYDWISSIKNNLWEKSNLQTNPCPPLYSVPTIDEILNETVNNDLRFLKLPFSGFRDVRNGLKKLEGIAGSLWSSSASGKYAKYFSYTYNKFEWNAYGKAVGRPVRCIKN